MSVSSSIRKTSYVGDGVTVGFPTVFVFRQAADLVVTVAGVAKVLGVDYTVAGGNPGTGSANGTVTFTAAPAAAAAVLIQRTVDFLQPIAFRSNGPFSPRIIEDDLDFIVFQTQELNDRLASIEAGGNIGNITAGNGLQLAATVLSVKPGNGSSNVNPTGGVVVDGTGVGVSFGVTAELAVVKSDHSVAAQGVKGDLARADHAHVAQTAAPGTINSGDAAAQGVSDSLARADHAHNVPVPTVIASLSNDALDAGIVGSSAKFAREDHRHSISTGPPSDLTDSTNVQGTATNTVRADHQHSHGNRGGGPLHAVATTAVNGFMSAGDKTIINDGPGKTASGTCQTNDAATNVTLIDSGLLTNGNCYQLLIRISALRDTGAAGFGVYVAATFRMTGGVVTQVGANTELAKHADSTNGYTIVISGAHVLVKVTGVAAQIFNYRGSMTMVVAP